MKEVVAAIALSITTGLGMAGPAYAVNHARAAASATSALADGEVRKIDKAAKKVTLRHGPLENLDMPAMTMVFQVKDAAMLDALKIGDKVKFSADKVGGAYTVMHIEPAK